MATNELEFPKDVCSLFSPILKAGHSDKISFENLFDNIDEEKLASLEWAKFDNIIQQAYLFSDYTETHKSKLELLRHTIKNRRSSQRYYERKKQAKKNISKNNLQDK